MIHRARKFRFRICVFSIVVFRETIPPESAIPTNQEVNVDNTIQSKRIVLSSKLEADCPFFL
jgi:hypothetical protein